MLGCLGYGGAGSPSQSLPSQPFQVLYRLLLLLFNVMGTAHRITQELLACMLLPPHPSPPPSLPPRPCPWPSHSPTATQPPDVCQRCGRCVGGAAPPHLLSWPPPTSGSGCGIRGRQCIACLGHDCAAAYSRRRGRRRRGQRSAPTLSSARGRVGWVGLVGGTWVVWSWGTGQGSHTGGRVGEGGRGIPNVGEGGDWSVRAVMVGWG